MIKQAYLGLYQLYGGTHDRNMLKPTEKVPGIYMMMPYQKEAMVYHILVDTLKQADGCTER